METREIPLTGGRMTAGVVRVGNTVRRPRKPSSETVRRLLSALRQRGFTYCPAFLGFDEQGREIHEYMEGYNPPNLGYTSKGQFLAMMKIVRRLHDCSAGLVEPGKVLCHHDLSPCNVIFDRDCRQPDSQVAAIIDWDSCGPGERWEELCYICWLWLDLGNLDLALPPLLEAIGEGLAYYGAERAERVSFSGKLLCRMQRVANSVAADKPTGWRDTVDWVRSCQSWVLENAMALDAAAQQK